MRLKQRGASFLLALCMLVGLPVSALAAESQDTEAQTDTAPVTTAEEFISAIEAAPTDGTPTSIVIGGDIQLAQQITIQAGQDITLVDDGTARTIQVGYVEGEGPRSGICTIEEGAVLTIQTSQNGRDDLLVLDGEQANSFSGEYNFYSKDGSLISCDGEFNLEGGTIQNFTSDLSAGGVISIRGANATFNMNGGVIQNNTFRNQYAGIVTVSGKNARFVMDGGQITNNDSMPGGQIDNATVYIWAKDMDGAGVYPSFTMNDGEISNNHGDYGAVFLGESANPDFYSKATMEFNGGSIANNTAENYGGGVMICGQAGMTMNGGEIIGNRALMGGGIAVYDLYVSYGGGQSFEDWQSFFPADFTMNGGTIHGNQAISENSQGVQDAGCGGGIYVASNKVVLKAGEITDNYADQQGGGVYVGSVPYTLHMYDALITNNEASILGGGLWFCPTGDVVSNVTNGGAIFGNRASAVDPAMGAAGDDFVSVPREGQGHSVTLADRILGGGEVQWYADSAVLTTSPVGTNILGKPDTSVPRYDPQNPGERMTDITEEDTGLALKAVVSEAAMDLAEEQAKLIITGNQALRGGGVGSNGGIIIGSEDEWELSVTKAWNGVDEADRKPVTISLKIGEYVLDEVELNTDNGWTASFTQLPNPDSLGDLKITAIENGQEYDVSYSEVVTDNGSKQLSITVTNSPLPQPVGDLTVSKTVSGSGASTTKEFTFTVTLDDNTITGTYGDMAFEGGVATIKLAHGQSATASGLPAGIKYTVTESDNSGYTVTSTGETGTIPEGQEAEAAFDNYKSSGGGGGGGSSYTSVTVKKVWKLDDGGTAPDSITVALMRDGKQYKTVELNEGNGWKYTWNRLNDRYDWTVEELDVPDGFTVSVDKKGNTITITNDDKPTTPTDPDEPENPDKPVPPPDPDIPDDSDVPEEPDTPTTPENPGTPTTPDEPDTPTTPDEPGLPQTGQLWWPVVLMMAMGAVLALTGVFEKRGTTESTKHNLLTCWGPPIRGGPQQ